MRLIEREIIETGRKLAELKPDSKALRYAREWWKNGCVSRYANEDFDVLNGMVSEISTWQIENAKSGLE